MEENGNGNGGNNDPQRDEKGRFLKGHGGGPGRGKKSDDMDGLDFWDFIEQAIKRDVKSKNASTRQRAISNYFKWKAMREAEKGKEEAVSVVLSPNILEALELIRCKPTKKLQIEPPKNDD